MTKLERAASIRGDDPELGDREDVQDDEVIGRALWISALIGGCLLLVGGGTWAALAFFGRSEAKMHETAIALPEVRDVASITLPHIPFQDITAQAGIDWMHVSGMEGEKLLPETMGGGVAIFDFDSDGHQDVLFVGGCSWPWSKQPIRQPRSLCLYRNDGQAHFTDVTEAAGLQITLYGMGPAVGDFDNDGWIDLFITSVGENRLFRNNQGVFEEVTAEAGVGGAEDAWSSGATWLDYDRDGRLDLFVSDYVIWKRELDLSLGFSLTGIGRAYGQPTSFTGTQSHLYHNEGDGKFRDVSQEMGIEVVNSATGVPVGKGLGVAAVDVDRDGWVDIMVANDTVQNFLFINRQGKAFEELAIPMGVAFDRSGNATGAMGLDCSFMRNDESLAIAIGNFSNEQSSLYVTRGAEPPFVDNAMSSGLGPASRLDLTFGMFFADLDLDSRQDIVCSNGHLESEISKVQSTQQYEQPPRFFWNVGSQGSTELVPLGSEQLGEEAVEPMVGRGAAYGDLDGDGDLDVVLVANSGPPRLLRNEQQLGNRWLRLKLEGSGHSNRDAYGALVTLVAGGHTQRRIVTSTRSYISQCESIVTFGLGDATGIDRLTIQWPDGSLQELSALEVDRVHHIRQP